MNASQQGGDRVVVVGLFQRDEDVTRAIRGLREAGFPESGIGLAARNREQQDQLTEETGTKAAQSGAAGAVGGGVLGGVIGLLAGVGAIAIPGVGPIIAGGVLASTLAGAGVGAVAGGIGGALVGMGVHEGEARHFEQGFNAGGILLTVEAGTRAAEARTVMGYHGADLGPTYRLSASPDDEEGIRTGAGLAASSRHDPSDRSLMDRVLDGHAGEEHEADEAWRGNERRYRHDPGYSGPERRRVSFSY
jgi:hypothetical protein